jgi:prepilin peptidase CpaA
MSWLNWANTHWPIVVVCAGMIAAAVIDWWKFKVPNKLTFPLIFSGWALGLLNQFEVLPFGGEGGIGAALAGTFLAGGLLLPVYAIGGMGAGDVKMSMGFGAWMGAFYGFGDPGALTIILWAFCVGAIVGGLIAMGMIIVRGQYRQNAEHFREIVGDLFGARGIGDVADKANKRRSRWHRLPYGVPLCIGFVGYLIYYYSATA